MKKRYVLAALAAVTVLAGCGSSSDSTKETTKEVETTETSDSSNATTDAETAEADTDAADGEMATDEEIDPEFSQDVENNEVIEVDDEEEEDADVTLAPITPSDYLVENASDYVTLGDYDGVEVTKYTYEITDDMIQEEIQEELADASEEESTNAPSETDNIVYFNLTSKVEGEEDDGEEEETFITLGQEEFGAEFDEKLTGVSTGDKLDFTIEYGDDTWQENWAGKKVDFSVEVTDVTQTNTPEYDEDYIKNYTGYDTKEEYEASVKEYLEQSYEEQSYYDEMEALLSACIDKSEFTGEYPEDLFNACKEEALSSYSMFVGEDGDVQEILDMFGITDEDIENDAKDLVNRRLFISAYAQANNIDVTEAEYVEYVQANADYYGENVADFEEMYTRETIVNALYENKVTEALLEKAKVTEEAYDFDEMEEYDSEDTLDDMEVIGDTDGMEEAEEDTAE